MGSLEGVTRKTKEEIYNLFVLDLVSAQASLKSVRGSTQFAAIGTTKGY